MIYKVVNGEIHLNPDAISLVPAFAKLKEPQIRYLVIAYDYVDGPYKRKSEESRKDLAKKITGVSDKDISEKVIEEFKSCLFDIKRDRKQLYQKKLVTVQKQFEDEISPNKMKEYSQIMDFLEKKIEEFDSEIMKEEEANIILKGDRQLSLIEKYMRNRKLYSINKKEKENERDRL